MEALRDAHLAEHEAAGRAEDARRRFLEAAVCHPGPPMSEHEDYDPDADLSDLEGSVLERMDMETRWHRELMEIRREAEGILARTPDPSRSTVQVFKDLLAHFIAFHQHLEERVTAATEQVASTKRAALDTLDERQVAADARLAREVNTVAMLRRRCERYEGWWALPVAQRHPLGPEFSDGVGSSRPDLAEIEQIVNNAVAKRYPNGGHHEETLPLVERVRREIGRGLATLPSRDPAAPGLPVRTPAPSAEQGLFRKYKVCRWDGMCDPVDSEYFVLRLPAAPGSPEQRALAAYADTIESTHPQLAGDMRARYQLRGPVAVDNGQRDAVAEHIRAAGGDPEAATVAQIADALNATSEGVTFTPNEAGDGVTYEIDQKARVSSIEVVGGDRVAELGLAPAQARVGLRWQSADIVEMAPPRTITPTTDVLRDFVPPPHAGLQVDFKSAHKNMTDTAFEEAGEWAGAARPERALMPVEVRSRCHETGETRFARCPWTGAAAVDTVELPPGGSQTDLCETAIALYQQRGQTDQTPFVITGFIPALSPDPDLCWMRGPPKVMQRIIANPDEPEDVRRWTWVGVGGVTFTRAKP